MMSDRILFYGASGRGVVESISVDNTLRDERVIPAGGFASDWTQITALSGNRVFFYGKSTGRGVVCSLKADHGIGDVKVFPQGSFATDWTQVTALSGDRILFYAPSGRGVICSVDAANVIKDVKVFPQGSFATDWTQITALSGDRILFYGKSTGRGVVCSVDSSNAIKDVTVFPAGSFATDWTQVTALQGGRVFFYAPSGRGVICSVDTDNKIKDGPVFPAGSFATDWREVAFLQPPGKPSSWAVVLIQFSDATTPPSYPRERFKELFTGAGVGKFNMVDNFWEMSHGKLDLSVSRVFGWYPIPQKTSDYTGSGANPAGRQDLITWARKAASNAGEDLSPYADRVFVITHPPTDLFGGVGLGGVSGDGRDDRGMSSLSPALVGQEMGHVYALDHSRAGGIEYRDGWDVMSNRGFYYMAPHPVYTELDGDGQPIWRMGPGLNAANMQGRSWLDTSRVWQAGATESDKVVDLRPLHSRGLAGYLCARVGPYFFEFRVKEGWDAEIPQPCVLVHEFNGNQSDLLLATNGHQDLRTGDEFLRGNPASATGTLVRVKVLSIDASSRTARLSVTRRP
ncbi:hypothetical protein ACGFY0_01675 [Streptomyces chartreusis]|uniref:hypothetical protein n=1 Tax=Streptomyces chartreusis TaxID=1969 RepID=UPI00372204D6